MKQRIQIKLFPEASFLLGGVTFHPAYDSVTALEDDIPYLTPTAIKGALRMEMESFSLGIFYTDDGKPVSLPPELSKIRFCNKQTDFDGCEDENCVVCSLFGNTKREGKLRFNAAHVCKQQTPLLNGSKQLRLEILEKGKREGVAISRELGKSQEHSYYSYLPYPDTRNFFPLSFETDIDCRVPVSLPEIRFLELFFAFLSRSGIFIGARKSVGLGHFKIEYCLKNVNGSLATEGTEDAEKIDGAAERKGNLTLVSGGEDGVPLKLYCISLRTCEPLVVGHIKNLYINDTLPYIPATALGGAIGFALTGNGISGEVVHNAFIDNRTLTPFHCYVKPQKQEISAATGQPVSVYNPPYPLPASMRRKKGGDSQVTDILLEDYIIKHAIDSGKFLKVKDLFEQLYRSSLRPVSICHQPETSYLTRIAINREFQKTQKEKLYSMEVINKGTEFCGLLIAEEWIVDVLKKIKHLYIGGKRNRGFGRTRIESIREINNREVINATPAVDIRLRQKADFLGLTIPEDRVFYTLDLLSDIGIPAQHRGEADSFEAYVRKRLFPDLDLILEKAFPLLGRCGSYGGSTPNATKEKPLIEKITAGSTFLVSVPKLKTSELEEKINHSLRDSTGFDWDATPLFRVNNPEHIENMTNGD